MNSEKDDYPRSPHILFALQMSAPSHAASGSSIHYGKL